MVGGMASRCERASSCVDIGTEHNIIHVPVWPKLFRQKSIWVCVGCVPCYTYVVSGADDQHTGLTVSVHGTAWEYLAS